jgi:diacylglycerol kinase (ATP)
MAAQTAENTDRLVADPARLTLLVNPTAGHGRARIMGPRIAASLRERLPNTTVDMQICATAKQAGALAHEVVAGAQQAHAGQRADVLATLGGDGTASLGINACADSGIPLAVFPAGTGDDFRRGIGSPLKRTEVIDAVVAGTTKRVDLLASSRPRDPAQLTTWVGSVVATGYDARVNRRVNRARINLGPISYALAVLREAVDFKPLRYRLTIDEGPVRELDALLVAVGNCGYFGGGIKICPDADPTDGLLNVTIVHPVAVRKLLTQFRNLYNGRFSRLPEVEMLTCRSIRVDGPGLFGLADGEEIGHAPLALQCRPGVLDVFATAEPH